MRKEISKTKRYINAALIPITTLFALWLLLATNPQSRTVLEHVGIAAAILAAFLISAFHYSTAGYTSRIPVMFLGSMITNAIIITIGNYMIAQRTNYVDFAVWTGVGLAILNLTVALFLAINGLKSRKNV